MTDKSGTLAVVIASERKLDNGVPVTDVQVDASGDVQAADLFQQPGDDSLPLAGDTVLLQESAGTGVQACVGFNDPVNQGQAEPGERRAYSRKADGTPAAEYWLKANGDVVIRSFVATGRIIIETEGQVIVKSPDIRLGDENSSRQIACVGDMVSGSVRALSAAPGSPIIPVGAAPTPSGGVPFVGQIISGSSRAKAK